MSSNLPEALQIRYARLSDLNRARWDAETPEVTDAVEQLVHELEGEMQSAEYVFLGAMDRFLGEGGSTMMLEMSRDEFESFYRHVEGTVKSGTSAEIRARFEALSAEIENLLSNMTYFIDNGRVWDLGD